MLEHMQFSNGEEIIDAYEYGERFDLVFMDVEMGETDGIQSGQIIDKYYKFRKFDLIQMEKCIIIFYIIYE